MIEPSQVFAYGTLMNRDNIHAVIGRSPTTYGEVLSGYKKVGLNIVKDDKSEVQGVCFEVNAKELKALDKYEGVEHDLYYRFTVTLESGEEAWVYQKVDPNVQVAVGDVVG